MQESTAQMNNKEKQTGNSRHKTGVPKQGAKNREPQREKNIHSKDVHMYINYI